jgi:hypothetical protein
MMRIIKVMVLAFNFLGLPSRDLVSPLVRRVVCSSVYWIVEGGICNFFAIRRIESLFKFSASITPLV